jgi:aminopeptidase N
MTSRYSELFGEHPFEKNGFATLNSFFAWGGMENQTLTSLCPNCWGENLVSHEFAHQWFGDMITCATWADIWLNEGFATYCEALWYEYTNGYAGYKSAIQSDASYYMANNPGWPIYNPQWAVTTPSVNTLFNEATTYDKGAGVLHMLRYVLGDSVFFAALKSYATDMVNFKYKTATTDDFVKKMSDVAGRNLTWFFDQWVKQPNFPVYANEFSIDQNKKSISFRARQTQRSPVLFQMPIELRVSFTSGPDTTVQFTQTVIDQTTAFSFSRVPANVTFDPDNEIVLKQATTNFVTDVRSDAVHPLQFTLEQNYPNPFNPVTMFRYEIPFSSSVDLRVFDLTGREVAVVVSGEQEAGAHVVSWDASAIASGTYFYRLRAGSFEETKKLIVVR